MKVIQFLIIAICVVLTISLKNEKMNEKNTNQVNLVSTFLYNFKETYDPTLFKTLSSSIEDNISLSSLADMQRVPGFLGYEEAHELNRRNLK